MKSKTVVTDNADIMILGLSRLIVIPVYTMAEWNSRMLANLYVMDPELRRQRAERYIHTALDVDVASSALEKRGMYNEFMRVYHDLDIDWKEMREFMGDMNVIGDHNRLIDGDEMEIFRCHPKFFTTAKGQPAIELRPEGDHYLHVRHRYVKEKWAMLRHKLNEQRQQEQWAFSELNRTTPKGGKQMEVVISSSPVSSIVSRTSTPSGVGGAK